MSIVELDPSRTPDSAAQCRVLLVEDDVIAQDILLLMLGRLGYRADLANDGVDAVSAMQSVAYDVVLMDVQMPRMNGMEATRLIRGAPDPGDQPTIIGMSADTSPQCQDQCRRAGMDAHLGKPVRIGELGTALELRIHRPGTFAVLDGDGHGPPAAPEPAAAVYDADVFESLLADLGGDEAMRREIADSFLFDIHERLTAIAAAGQAVDLGALAFQAHAIKSASATLGLRALSEAANRIEAMALADGVDVGEQASRLVLECGRATDALSAAVDGTTGPR